MTNCASTPDFDELAFYITETFDALRTPYLHWANLARRAIQSLPYDAYRLAELERQINAIRADLRKAALVASEHFTEEQLTELRRQARMSKHGWKSLMKSYPITMKNGFKLVMY